MKAIATLAGIIVSIGSTATLADEAGSLAKFNHWDLNKDWSRSVSAAPGSYVTIRVEDTCDAFKVDVIEVPDADKNDASSSRTLAALEGMPIKIEFSDVFDCYVLPTAQEVNANYTGLANFRVDVSLKPNYSAPIRSIKPDWKKAEFSNGDKPSAEKFLKWFGDTIDSCIKTDKCTGEALTRLKEAKKEPDEKKYRDLLEEVGLVKKGTTEAKFLNPVNFFVYVRETDWRTEFAGAFVVSDLVNPQYAIRNNVVVRDKEAEDSQSMALAAFVHVSNRKWGGDHWALTFGLGVNNSSDLNIFFGPSFRMGGMGYITGGYNWGKIDRLPNGQAIDAAPINGENTLTNLPKKTESGWFIGWSFPFLGSARNDLQKPFAKPSGAP